MGRVSGKVALITGGARGMGASHARHLVAEGAKVVITDILDKEGLELAATLGPNSHFLHHDVTDEARWQAVVEETEALFGPVTVLINNAGILSVGPIETETEAAYRRVIDINQVSVFLGMKSVIPSMRRAGGGSIINISSAAGLTGTAGAIAYSASKFAVRGMTKTAAVELAPLNIRVNSIHPGLTLTPMLALADDSYGEAIEHFTATIPVGRLGEAEDITAVVLLLASDEARYSTGAEFVVDGGFSCH